MLADLETDPTEGLRFRAKGEAVRPRDVLTREELGAFLKAAEAEPDDIQAMFWLGFTTGVRFGELSPRSKSRWKKMSG